MDIQHRQIIETSQVKRSSQYFHGSCYYDGIDCRTRFKNSNLTSLTLTNLAYVALFEGVLQLKLIMKIRLFVLK